MGCVPSFSLTPYVFRLVLLIVQIWGRCGQFSPFKKLVRNLVFYCSSEYYGC